MSQSSSQDAAQRAAREILSLVDVPTFDHKYERYRDLIVSVIDAAVAEARREERQKIAQGYRREAAWYRDKNPAKAEWFTNEARHLSPPASAPQRTTCSHCGRLAHVANCVPASAPEGS